MRYATVLTISLIGFVASYALIEAGDNDSVEAQLLESLPPDPGPAGELTIEGIDSDNDGVRDDVQRWIALTSPSSQKMREALTQTSKAMQRFLLDGTDPVKSFDNALQLNRGMYCMVYIDGSMRSIDLMSELEAKMSNTNLRSKRWLQADRYLSGKFYTVPKNKKSGCDFDPDMLPN